MADNGPNDPDLRSEFHETAPPDHHEPVPPAGESPESAGESEAAREAAEKELRARRILIGSQRDPAAYRARQSRDWEPVVETPSTRPGPAKASPPVEPAAGQATPEPDAEAPKPAEPLEPASAAESPPPEARSTETVSRPSSPPQEAAPAETAREQRRSKAGRGRRESKPDRGSIAAKALAERHQPKFAPPSIRDRLSPDLEQEFEEALGDASLEDLIDGGQAALGDQAQLEPRSRHQGKVVAVRREDVFIELGGREQGYVPVVQFGEELPEVGATVDVMVQGFNSDEGLYVLSRPGAAMDVEDWSELSEGMLVDARITGHNTGGLECEVSRIRGFIPVSQVSLYRVENLEEFVGEKFTCLVTEANENRGNLVLSRRAVLEREREEAKQQLLATLEPGQVFEGTVRKLMDFGAFVELGNGVDGLLHISQLAWGRVNHPSDVLSEGQHIKVKIEKYDPESGRIGLSYRDMLENPWDDVTSKYPLQTVVSGTVVKLMEFGAFVELEPGVEGLVHISELSHKRVFRTSDVVKEGDQIDVMVLSVDPDSQRISLSIKEVSGPPEPEKKPEDEALPEAAPSKKKLVPPKDLKGGLGRPSAGEQFGLKW